MPTLVYPSVTEYILPKRNVLVLSCMDLRLTDNLVDFLEHDNLQNRYDHFILAGASLLCCEDNRSYFLPGSFEKYAHWKKALEDHLELAVALHQIKDVYIIEHQDCGAYAQLLDSDKADLSTLDKEKEWHAKFSEKLALEINSQQRTEGTQPYHLNVHCFFIDLRGNVELLYSTGNH